MSEKKFLPYAKQSVTTEDINAVIEAIGSDWITRGPMVEDFEEGIAEYCGAVYAVAFSSGSAALDAASHAAQVGAFDRVITTPNSFVATAGPAIRRGATPVFVDIDPKTGNLDLEQLKYTVETPSTRGKQVIIPVHFSGIAVDMESLNRSLVNPESIVIEDAAHALGSSYNDGQKVGCCFHSDMTVFSFHPAKTITTGEGGMVTTNDRELFERLREFRNNGIEKPLDHPDPWYYEVKALTGNFNFTDFQAALGLSQLNRLDATVLKRRELVTRYREKLKDVPHLCLFSEDSDDRTCHHLMIVQIDFDAYGISRSETMHRLLEKGIGTQVHYIPVYRHPFFKDKKGDISEYFPKMERYYAQALTLPLYSSMGLSDVDCVVSSLKNILR
jgi:UDP-4-amino-4,6-dideoxy-L-N-acetyl-beta-L-altrosamine transaminase